MKKTRIYFFIRTVWDFIPGIWRVTKHKYYSVDLFYCNDDKDWLRYKDLQREIAKLVKGK